MFGVLNPESLFSSLFQISTGIVVVEWRNPCKTRANTVKTRTKPVKTRPKPEQNP